MNELTGVKVGFKRGNNIIVNVEKQETIPINIFNTRELRINYIETMLFSKIYNVLQDYIDISIISYANDLYQAIKNINVSMYIDYLNEVNTRALMMDNIAIHIFLLCSRYELLRPLDTNSICNIIQSHIDPIV